MLKFKEIEKRSISPTRLLVYGFLLLIFLGAGLLTLPISSSSGEWTDPLTAFFTATSATCVTGLVLVDTGTYWSGVGQFIILILIQIGGLGFMTIATLFSLMLKRTITLKERMVMTTSLNINDISGIVRLTRRILLGTVLFESVGAIILSIRFVPQFGLAEGIKKGIFHAVSAFCNAGFDLMGELGEFSSMTYYANDVVVNMTLMLLVILGGLGFMVWADIYEKNGNGRLMLNTRIVLWTTAILIIGGTLLFYIYERTNPLTMGEMSNFDAVLASLFQSVTTRTAGFNSIDQAALTGPSKALTMFLMFIGGSPGSTAGGIKTVTLAVLVLTAATVLGGKTQVVLNKRALSVRAIMNAVTIFIVGISVVAIGSFIIATADSLPYSMALYEAISAFGTVGLSMGVTPSLSTISKLLVIALMYIGRIGILTLGIAVLMRKINAPKIKYPEDRVVIG